MKTLREILASYDTDKDAVHSYGEFYENLFEPMRESVEHLLEIGVRRGESLRAWHEYFPKAKIFGVDNGEECGLWDPIEAGYFGKIFVRQADQKKLIELHKLFSCAFKDAPYLDVIIDDGCHDNYAQIATYGCLWPSVRFGGVYVIEDVENIMVARRLQQVFGGHIEDLRDVKGRYDDIIWWKCKE